MKHLSKYNEDISSSHGLTVRQYIEKKCLDEIRDVFTDVSDEITRFNVLVNSRDTRGRTLYEIQFTHRVSFGVSASIAEVKQHFEIINKIQMDTFDCVIRLEKMDYSVNNRIISITSDKESCGLSAKIHLWK